MVARAAGISALVVSLVALFFTTTGIVRPMQAPVVYLMLPSTAFCVAALSGAVLATLSKKHTLSRSWSTAAAVVAVIALVRVVLRWSQLESDSEALPRLFLDVRTALPNALAFLIGGIAIRAVAADRPSSHRTVFSAIAGALTATLGVCGLLNGLAGFLPANRAFEGELAVDATFSIAVLGIAIFCLAYSRGREADEPVNFSVPLVVAVIGTFGSFLMWRFLLDERSEAIAFQTSSAASTANQAIDTELRRLVLQLRYTADEPDSTIFQETAMQPGVPIRWADSRSLSAENEFLKAALPADRSRPSYGIVLNDSGPPELVFAAPKRTGGMRLAAMRVSDFVDPILGSVLGANFNLALYSDGRVLYRYPSGGGDIELPGYVLTSVRDLGEFRLEPRSEFVRRGGTASLHLALVMGLTATFLLAFSMYLLQGSRSQLTEVLEVRAGLELEVEQRRATEAELDRKAQLLQESNTELQEFAHVVSHDLQEPLRSISGFAQILKRRYEAKLDSEAVEFLEFITASSVRMNEMIQGLLAYSRLVHHDTVEELVPLSEAVYWAKSNLAMAVAEGGATIEYGELPTIKGNRLQLCQLMQNLIGNALKYRSAAPPIISITANTGTQDCVVTVADNGLGIGPEFQDRVFGLFKRAHGPDYAGTGVGLALCKKIVETHGGHIWVESVVGKGSKFHIRLPLN